MKKFDKDKYLNKRITILIILIIYFVSSKLIIFNKNDGSIGAYIDGELSSTIPSKNDDYVVEKIVCDNDAVAEWDDETWGILVKNMTKKSKCNVYFKKYSNSDVIANLSKNDTVNFATDDPDNNIRYIGKNPDNYIYFNCNDYSNQSDNTCEKWRIIGVFNNVTKSDGTKENLIKIIRNDSIGSLNWDIDYQHNNNWSKSGLQNLLNNGGYFYSSDGYYTQNGNKYTYDFKSTGLKNDITRNAIEIVQWNIGAVNDYKTLNSTSFYKNERSNTSYNSESSIWTGKIGLIYPSDYGYATSGGSVENRNNCLIKALYNWNDLSADYCKNNDYIFKQGILQWTITSVSYNSNQEIDICDNGKIFCSGSFRDTYPSLYLKSDISIIDGNGSEKKPYQLLIKSYE